ncbi:chemotaxis protein CheA [Pseudomonas sp. LP_7_YM]|uniref:chemotaxis protein CheA n=1 Tax=Pseudomonas sp. LP_7_YM TaxID=2485137 RepID=UPI00105D3443|nr:chemotaxis protein CheA [Pseudomonas sp. LP_7_YM]TDV62501.1 two-component system chemotaxis sensor kinase CheA [Pseudomonas sp. LP_7_YM]
MNINLDQALQTFIAEARELLQDMEQSLLQLEHAPKDADQLASIFRAAHTIKGSAGLFGLDPIVSFAHVVEDVLDRLRDGQVLADRNLIALMLECNDHLVELIEVVAVQRSTLAAQALDHQAQLRQRLDSYRQTQASVPLVPEAASAHATWHISVRFGTDMLRNGMDPLSFLRYLATLGELLGVVTCYENLPAAAQMDAESCYLGFEIRLLSEKDEASIAEAFEFVRDDCRLFIFAPDTPAQQYRQWLQEMGAEAAGLADALVHCGSVTAEDLLEPADAVSVVAATAAPAADKVVVENKSQRFIRVRADQLETLIDLAGELITASAGAQLMARQRADENLMEATSVVAGLVEQLLDGALAMRMVPIGDTFNRFQRVVRDVSGELGKDIELLISGADTELDKALVERIGDPLMHLLRNAMDHGIESPDVRLAAGKPARGTLRLNAFHDSGSIVLELLDDGAGLNRERILAKARERGLVGATDPSDRDLLNLIFEPGFSTAEAVTNLSGRGVGMDVVKRNITSLRGTIDLYSEPGQGTTVRIRLPLTLAMINGLLVEVAGGGFVVPLDVVHECIELPPGQRDILHQRGHIDLRGEVLPLVFLREQLALEGSVARRENVVVVKAQGQTAGLVVDHLMGEHQTVIKPLGPLFGSLRGISGSSILGNGSVALILDIPALLKTLIEQDNQRRLGSTGHSSITRNAI